MPSSRATSATGTPVNPAQIAEELTRAGPEGLGERLVRAYLGVLEEPAIGRPIVAMVRSAATQEQAAALLRGYLERELLGRIARAIDAPPPALRATLAGSQMVGLIMARYVVRVEPIASADTETLVAAIAPTVQRYLTGDIARRRAQRGLALAKREAALDPMEGPVGGGGKRGGPRHGRGRDSRASMLAHPLCWWPILLWGSGVRRSAFPNRAGVPRWRLG